MNGYAGTFGFAALFESVSHRNVARLQAGAASTSKSVDGCASQTNLRRRHMQWKKALTDSGISRRYGAALKPLAAAVMAVAASMAHATDTIVQIEMPVVNAGAGSGSSGTVRGLDWMTDELRA